MCLSIMINRPDDVLAKGEHLGFEWTVIHNRMGYRCGYVKVPLSHPWHGKSYGDLYADVHGGLTFAQADVPCDAGGPDNGHWFGFDCAHAGDAPDPELIEKGDQPETLGHRYEFGGPGSVCGQTYVEDECRKLCEQAQAAAVKP